MEQKASLTEQKASLTEQKASLTEQKASLTEQKASFTEQKASLMELKASLTEKKASLMELKTSLEIFNYKNTAIVEARMRSHICLTENLSSPSPHSPNIDVLSWIQSKIISSPVGASALPCP